MLPKLPFLYCFLVFCFWLRYELRKSKSKTADSKNTLFENEARANLTRKKPLSSLNYITVSEKSILFLEINDDNIKKIQKNFVDLRDKKIVNLSNKSNTELKAEYGPANLTVLSEYSDNFITLISSIQKYAKKLSELGLDNEAIEALEFSVRSGCDMISSYRLLTELYIKNNQSDKINALLENADILSLIQFYGITKPSLKDDIYNKIIPQLNHIALNTNIEASRKCFLQLFNYYLDCSRKDKEKYLSDLKQHNILIYFSMETGKLQIGSGKDIIYYPSNEMKEYFTVKPSTKFVDLEGYLQLVGKSNENLVCELLSELGVLSCPKIRPFAVFSG